MCYNKDEKVMKCGALQRLSVLQQGTSSVWCCPVALKCWCYFINTNFCFQGRGGDSRALVCSLLVFLQEQKTTVRSWVRILFVIRRCSLFCIYMEEEKLKKQLEKLKLSVEEKPSIVEIGENEIDEKEIHLQCTKICKVLSSKGIIAEIFKTVMSRIWNMVETLVSWLDNKSLTLYITIRTKIFELDDFTN